MKIETVIKVLKRYAKGLNVMACDCKTEDEKADKQHYQFPCIHRIPCLSER